MTPLLPWQIHPLEHWAIVSMRHYHIHHSDDAHLEVRFFRDGHEFEVSGEDTPLLWEEACRKAIELYPADAPGGRTPNAPPWEADRMRVLLAYEAEELTESQAARLLGLDIVSARELRQTAIAAGAAQWKTRNPRREAA